MSGSLITLPWRLGTRGAGLALRGAGSVADRAVGIAAGALRQQPRHEEDLDGARSSATSPPRRPDAEPPSTPEPEPADTFEPERPSVVAPAEQTQPPQPPAPPEQVEPPTELGPLAELEPRHVSEGLELVEEVAEPGAEDGAGAQITIAEPWDGYRTMNAGAVIDRLPGATSAELAAVELYELANRRRQTLLTAARRELQRRS